MSEVRITVEDQMGSDGKTKRPVFGKGEVRAWPPSGSTPRWRIKARYPDGTLTESSAATKQAATERGLEGPNDLVFPSWVQDGRYPWPSRTEWHQHLAAAEEAVGWRWDYHALRDSYATTLLNDLGMAPSDAIVFTGHISAKAFFERYVGTRPAGVAARAIVATTSGMPTCSVNSVTLAAAARRHGRP